MLILQRRGHNSPCMQRGQSFLGVKYCSKDHTKFPKLSAEHQNLMMVHVTTEADLGRKFEKAFSVGRLHKVPKVFEMSQITSVHLQTRSHTPSFYYRK